MTQDVAGTQTWYLADRLGSVRGLANGSGSLTASYNYDPLGTPEGPPPGAYGFTGEPQNSTLGLVQLRARWYAPGPGRFLTHDPLAATAGNAFSADAYLYGNDDPVNLTDPSGMKIPDEMRLDENNKPLPIDAFGRPLPGTKLATGAPTPPMPASIPVQKVRGSQVLLTLPNEPTIRATSPIQLYEKTTVADKLALTAFLAALDEANQYAITVQVNFGDPLPIGIPESELLTGAADTIVAGIDTTKLTAGVNLADNLSLDTVSLARDGEALSNDFLGLPCSFSATTLVATADGEKPIGAVTVGDHVLAYDQKTETTGLYTVTAVLVHDDPVLTHVTVNGERLETTPEHPFYTAERGWVAAGGLWVGAHVRKADGSTGVVQAMSAEQRTERMYNLTVDGAHTFFVGRQRLLVHNSCPPGVKAAIRAAVKAYPADSGKCEACARAIYSAFNKAGIQAQIGHIEADTPILKAIVEGQEINLSRYRGTPAFHEFVQVGGTIYDALSGARGLSWRRYMELFPEGERAFDPRLGYLNLTYRNAP